MYSEPKITPTYTDLVTKKVKVLEELGKKEEIRDNLNKEIELLKSEINNLSTQINKKIPGAPPRKKRKFRHLPISDDERNKRIASIKGIMESETKGVQINWSDSD